MDSGRLWGLAGGLDSRPTTSPYVPPESPAAPCDSSAFRSAQQVLNAFHSVLVCYNVEETCRNLVFVHANELVVKAVSLYTVLLRVREPVTRLSEDSLYLTGVYSCKRMNASACDTRDQPVCLFFWNQSILSLQNQEL